MKEKEPEKKSRPSWSRFIAVLLGLLFIIIFEIFLRVFGLGEEFLNRDPFYGFNKPQPLFEAKETRGGITLYSSDVPWQLGQFNIQRFSMPKPENTFRIFFFGGSTVFGAPYWDPGSFPRLLEKGLSAVSPFQRFEVINAGGVGYASNRIRLLINESFEYDPDLIILYTGNNEFIEQQFYLKVLDQPEWVLKLRARLYRIRLYGVLAGPVLRVRDKVLDEASTGRKFFEWEVPVEKELINWSPERRVKVEMLFAWNLEQIITSCRQRNVPLMLINPAVNFRDFPPNLSDSSVPKESYSPVQKELREGMNLLVGNQPEPALEKFREALNTYPDDADAHFYIGQCYLRLGERALAYRAFSRAADEDRMPTRVTGPLRSVMKDKGSRHGVLYFSAQELFESMSPDGIPGDNLFFDNCHPLFHGNWMIAREIVRVLIDKDIIRQGGAWEQLFDRAISRYQAAFTDEYLAMVYYRLALFLHQHINRPRRSRIMIERALQFKPEYEDALLLEREIDERIERENPPPWY